MSPEILDAIGKTELPLELPPTLIPFIYKSIINGAVITAQT